MTNKAVFLDRDGTLVHPRHYPSHPHDLCLYDGVCEELRGLQQAGLQLVVITNQAGIARGYFTEHDLQRMHAYLAQQLASHGVQLQAIYHCPHHPDGIVPDLARRCQCRKPAPGMLLQAANDLQLDLQACWFVGDILDDIEAGNSAGCRTILVDLGTERLPERAIRCPHFVARNTVHALRIIKDAELHTQTADLTYWPSSWPSTTNARYRVGATLMADTGRFVRKGVSGVGGVILSAAKNRSAGPPEILRCAQNDRPDRRVSNTSPCQDPYGRPDQGQE